MKKFKNLAIVLIVIISLTGCGNKSNKLTKEGYESLQDGDDEIALELLEEAAEVDKNKDTIKIAAMGREYVTLKEELIEEDHYGDIYYCISVQEDFETFKEKYKEYVKNLDLDKQWSELMTKKVDEEFVVVLDDIYTDLLFLLPEDIDGMKEDWNTILSKAQLKELDKLKYEIDELEYSYVNEDKLPSLENYDISMDLSSYFDMENPSEGNYPQNIQYEDEYVEYFQEFMDNSETIGVRGDYNISTYAWYSGEFNRSLEYLEIFRNDFPKYSLEIDEHISLTNDLIEIKSIIDGRDLIHLDIEEQSQVKEMIDIIVLKYEKFRNLGFIQEMMVYIYEFI